MKLIPLTQGKFVQVDDEDYDYLIQWKWHAEVQKHTSYAKRSCKENGKSTTIKIHRVIMKENDPNIFIDHIDHNGLNCQKHNMRKCTNGENTMNTSSRKKSLSKYLGVSWRKRNKKWGAKIKEKYLGIYITEEEAAMAYDRAAKELYGEFASLNFK